MAGFHVVGAILGCFWRFWGAKLTLFLIFWRNVTPPRGRWGFGGHHSFVERQRSPAAPCAPYGGVPCSDFCFHAGLCRFEIVGGVCAGCWWGDGSLMEHSAIAAPRCRAVRIISRQPAHVREPFGVGVLLFCCVLTGLLFDFSNVSDEAEATCRR